MLYIASMLPHAFDAFLGRLHVVDLVDGAIREVLGDWGEIGMAAWLPDSKQIVITGKPHGTQIGAKSDLWLTDRDGPVPVCRTAGLQVGVGVAWNGTCQSIPIQIECCAVRTANSP